MRAFYVKVSQFNELFFKEDGECKEVIIDTVLGKSITKTITEDEFDFAYVTNKRLCELAGEPFITMVVYE